MIIIYIYSKFNDDKSKIFFYLYKLIVRCRFFIAKYNTLFKQQVIEFYIQNGKIIHSSVNIFNLTVEHCDIGLTSLIVVESIG